MVAPDHPHKDFVLSPQRYVGNPARPAVGGRTHTRFKPSKVRWEPVAKARCTPAGVLSFKPSKVRWEPVELSFLAEVVEIGFKPSKVRWERCGPRGSNSYRVFVLSPQRYVGNPPRGLAHLPRTQGRFKPSKVRWEQDGPRGPKPLGVLVLSPQRYVGNWPVYWFRVDP